MALRNLEETQEISSIHLNLTIFCYFSMYYVFLFSEDNNPSSGTFWVGHNDLAPGPVNWRSLPLAGRLLVCLPLSP